MKKIILAAVALCTAYISNAGGPFNVEKAGGGAFGYRLVVQTTDQSGTLLTCSGAGYDKCQLTTPPSIPEAADVQRAFDYADAELDNGKYSGQASIGAAYVTWSGEDAYNCTINIVTNN